MFLFSFLVLAPLHGFAFWFDVEFNGPPTLSSANGLQFLPGGSYSDSYINGSNNRTKRTKSDETIVLSTAPEDDPTHWQQVKDESLFDEISVDCKRGPASQFGN